VPITAKMVALESTENQDDAGAVDQEAALRSRRLKVLSGCFAFVVIIACVGIIASMRYRPLEIVGTTEDSAQTHLSEPSGTFVLKYVLAISNKGPFPVMLVKIDPVTLGGSNQPVLDTQAFLPPNNVYGEHNPFHSMTISKGQVVEVAIRATVSCTPLSHEWLSILNQIVTLSFLGLRHTESLDFPRLTYPVTLEGPQSCKK
jgi:hypothetical protein